VTAEPPVWSAWLVRGIALAAGLALVRNGVHGLRGRPLVLPRRGELTTTAPYIARGWWARVWGAFALCVAAGLLLVAVAGYGAG
jgi:hypothetical protein